MYVNITFRRPRATIVVVEKQQVQQNLCVCVLLALDIQHAIRMRHIFFLWPAPLYSISTLSHKWHEFRNKLLNIKCVWIKRPTRCHF